MRNLFYIFLTIHTNSFDPNYKCNSREIKYTRTYYLNECFNLSSKNFKSLFVHFIGEIKRRIKGTKDTTAEVHKLILLISISANENILWILKYQHA